MSIKLDYLHGHLDGLSANLSDVSEEQGFHQDINQLRSCIKVVGIKP